jgi:hypothetical protein
MRMRTASASQLFGRIRDGLQATGTAFENSVSRDYEEKEACDCVTAISPILSGGE